jgi:hypothetical protein
MSKVVRLSYWDSKTAKNKYLQTNVDLHGSREEAKQFLINKKNKILGIKQDDNKEEVKEEVKEEIKPEIKKDEKYDFNLMDIPVDSSPQIDKIISELKYSPFKLDIDPKTGTSITIFGSTKSYKTYLLKRILKKYYSEDCIVSLFAQNIHNDIYDDIDKNIIKLDHYSPQLVKKMAQINKKVKPPNKYRFVAVLDDIINSKNEHNLEELYLTLRNSRISIITCLQNIQLLKSTSRGNSNFVIFRKFNQPQQVYKYAMQEYLQYVPPFKDLDMGSKINLYMKITNKHDYFVLNVLDNTLILCQEEDIDK